MRLTHLKLAGFKSFVDPTTLHIHGQRVGVVGPNGCGKSNVMESIRWVLGESSAREMRGDSMQDVIFNGSGNRKPVARASVELLFDNSLGSAGGEWSQYAEISVKRLLQRDSGSTYYINNSQVRRRDVADLFLGTGLGGRAYAIIGQNTISRIVEAKPEELRIFLEEAAGISKYKERRRETELRLRDTRDNLTRVEDIRREMEKQILRLESQAEVARRYHELQRQLSIAQAQGWLLKKRDAGMAWEKSRRQVEKLANELEAQTAALRAAETALEKLRLDYQGGSETVQQAQAAYYEANAQVSTLEQQLRHAQENRQRLEAQLAQIDAEKQRTGEALRAGREQLAGLLQQQQQAVAETGTAQQQLAASREALPAAEIALRDAQAAFSQVQNAILQHEQRIQLENTHLDHDRKTLSGLTTRAQRIQQELNALQMPDPAVLSQNESEAAALQDRLAALESELARSQQAEQAQAEQARKLQQTLHEVSQHLARIEAQAAALQKLQQALGHEHKLQAWMEQSRLGDARRLWQLLKVEPGCETALEGLLGARLNALISDVNIDGAGRPPAAVVVGRPDTASLHSANDVNDAAHPAGWRPLMDCLAGSASEVQGLIGDWLHGAWLLPAGQSIAQASRQLRPGEWLVNRDGDVASLHSLYLHAAQSGLHGVLERQRELESLQIQLPQAKAEQQAAQAALHAAEESLRTLRQQIHAQQQQQRQQTAAAHAMRMELQRLQQQQQHALERQRLLHEDAAATQQQTSEIERQIAQRQLDIAQLQQAVAALRQQREQTGNVRQLAEQGLKQCRETLQEAERRAQKQEFSEKILLNNISDLENRIKAMDESLLDCESRREAVSAQLSQVLIDQLNTSLQQALNLQQSKETLLAEARNAQSGIEQQLGELERGRLQNEQQLHPARDKLEQARLNEQQARLHFEYCAGQLAASGEAEAALEQSLDKSAKSADLEQAAAALETAIAELGAVNLAAIEELASERERKTYLDSQAGDLEEAMVTLEEAIRRIDRETRSRLQATFDEANRHFAELFTTLFGGGQAQLQMLGDEILDTGMQVFAQPPGKKNSTIHLLSGGEKALTALALVFALFRLNPAPFCLMDEVDAPLDDSNTERFCALVRKMSERTQFLFVSHNKITMEMAQQLVGVTMQESGVSRIVEVDIEAAMQMQTELAL